MLVINPSECIDCGMCEPECPAEAILPDTESGLEKWLELNNTFSAQWPNVSRKNDQTPDDADEHKGEEGKFEKYFSPEPGRSEEHPSELQSLMRISSAVFCLKKTNTRLAPIHL